MTTLTSALSKLLKDATKVAVVGIGNELRGDDGAGVLVARELLKKGNLPQKLVVFDGGSSPENITGEIARAMPTHIVLVDCANMNLSAGEVRLIESANADSSPASTHTMPLGVLAMYLSRTTGAKIVILAIQPKIIHFGAQMTPAVLKSSKDSAMFLLKLTAT